MNALIQSLAEPQDARAAVLAWLVANGKVDDAALSRAELIAARNRQPVEQILNQLGGLSDDDLAEAYAEITALPVWIPADLPATVTLTELGVSPEFLQRRRIVPVAVADGVVTCATCDPLDPEAAAGLAFATGLQVRMLVARPAEQRRALEAMSLDAGGAAAELDRQRLEREIDQVADLGAASAGSRVVSAAFEAAIKLGASDIHFEPRRNDLRVRLRVDGQMLEHQIVGADLAAAAVSRVKVIANLDVGERRLPQDGRTSFVFGGRSIDVRVATSPTVFGESAVLRILDRSTVRLDLEALGLNAEVASQMKAAAHAPHGMFLISGPTGSGKTTTLYALLQTFAGSPKKVLSVEDPVEYHFEHVTQTQVAPQIGLTFAAALRSFLRQDPDVVLVGEIRDPETASVAVQAAMTGHLLLASVHANDALSVIPRLLDMGVEPYQLAAAGFRGRGGPAAGASAVPGLPGGAADHRCGDAVHRERGGSRRRSGCTIPAAAGAATARGSRDAWPSAEAFLATEPFIRAIAQGATGAELMSIAREAGFQPMTVDAAQKLGQGLTSLQELAAALHG